MIERGLRNDHLASVLADQGVQAGRLPAAVWHADGQHAEGGQRSFYRLYLVPGMNHGFANGSPAPGAVPPLPTNADLYLLLTDWVEKGVEPPSQLNLSTLPGAALPASRPICLYPQKPTYQAGNPLAAASYACL